MTHEEFKNLVRKMRAAQVNYFRTRDRYQLSESKRLEREVDGQLKEPEIDTQTKLF